MKFLSLNDATKEQLIAQFKEFLDKSTTYNESLKFTAKLTPTKETARPTILFSPEAYLKTMLFIRDTETEIAWHGTVTRHNDTTFYINDVFLYPQIIAATTVDTDQEKYNKWIETLDDNTFNTMRLQGHSHVHMSTSPSATDTNFYEDILSTLSPDDFYIFMIGNKRGEMTFFIYDLKTNIVYDTKDIDIKLTTGNIIDLLAVIQKDKDAYCTKRTYTNPQSTYINSHSTCINSHMLYGNPYARNGGFGYSDKIYTPQYTNPPEQENKHTYQNGYGYGIDQIENPDDVNNLIDQIYDKYTQTTQTPTTKKDKGKGKKK